MIAISPMVAIVCVCLIVTSYLPTCVAPKSASPKVTVPKVVVPKVTIPKLSNPLKTSSGRPKFSDTTKDDFQDECIKKHNTYRAKHAFTLPLKLDKKIVEYAKKRCENISSYSKMPDDHPGLDDDHGENIYFLAGSVKKSKPAICEKALNAWYKESTDYWKSPGVMGTSGHFTQLVWKTTTSVGCARCNAKVSNKYHSYIICNYMPPGNEEGLFDNNVLILK